MYNWTYNILKNHLSCNTSFLIEIRNITVKDPFSKSKITVLIREFYKSKIGDVCFMKIDLLYKKYKNRKRPVPVSETTVSENWFFSHFLFKFQPRSSK